MSILLFKRKERGGGGEGGDKAIPSQPFFPFLKRQQQG